MKNNFDDLLREALAPTEEPKEKLNRHILWKAKEIQRMKKNTVPFRKKIPAAAMIAVSVLALGSVTAAAAYKYLSPGQVAAEVKDETLKEAFAGENALVMHESQESGGYRITLLGSVAGKNISQYLSVDDAGIPRDDRLYTIVAIEHADGTPMPEISSPEYGEESFYVSCYIRGLNPAQYSLMSMGGGYTEFVKDGIQYRLLDMDNLEMFADKGLYVGTNNGAFYEPQAYRYDEATGEMSRNESYGGVNALFVLPLDPGRGDPAAAEAYLRKLEEEQNAPDRLPEMDEAGMEVEAFVARLTPQNIGEYAMPLESTRQECKPDSDGKYHYSWELEEGSGANGTLDLRNMISDIKEEECTIIGYSNSEDGLASLKIETVTLHGDGSLTYVVYVPILP